MPITWSCSLALPALPRCPPAHSALSTTYTAAWSSMDLQHGLPLMPCPTMALKDLQMATSKWPLESSVCKPLANTSSPAVTAPLIPTAVSSLSCYPHSGHTPPKSISLAGLIQAENLQKVFILCTISFRPSKQTNKHNINQIQRSLKVDSLWRL